MTEKFIMSARRAGKREAMERALAKLNREQPNAIIIKCGSDGIRVEKPVAEISRRALPAPDKDEK